jgi:hypothetical protein
MLLDLLMETFAFRAENDGGRGGPIHLVVIFGAALIDSVDPKAALFQVFEGTVDVDDTGDRGVFQRACRGLRNCFGEPGCAAFRDDDRTCARGICGTDDGAEIMRVFDAIEHDHEPGIDGGLIEIGILRGGSHGDDSLVDLAAGDALQGTAIFKADGRFGATGEVDDLLYTGTTGTLCDEDAIESPAGFERFNYWMKTNQNSQGQWILW